MKEEQPTFTFEGFEPANTTPVPDVLFDELLTELSGTELKVVLYIIRRTLGFKKVEDGISLSQFTDGITTRDGKILDKGCGIKKRSTVSKTLRDLIGRGYVEAIKNKTNDGDSAVTVYRVRFKGVVPKSALPSAKKSTTLVPKSPLPGSAQTATTGSAVLATHNKQLTTNSNVQETEEQEENALSSIDETRTLSSSSNSSPSITDEAIPSQAPSSEQRDTTQPLGEENGTSEPALPEIEAQREKEASAQANGVSDSQKNTGKASSSKPGNGSRKRSSKKDDVDLDAIVPVPPPDAPASDMPWSARKAILWADHFRGFAYPESSQPKSKYARVKDAVILIVQRGITEEQYVYMFRFMKGLLPNGLKSDYWSEHEVDAWTINDHWEDQVKEIKRKSGSLKQATQAVAAFAEAGVKPGMRLENGKLVIDSNKTVSGLSYFNIPQRGA